MRTYLFTVASIAVALSATSAFAAPITVADTMDSAATVHGADYGGYSTANFANRGAGGRHWGDEIADPAHRFDTTQITVDRNDAAHTMQITLRTRFNGSDLGAHYADIFIDTATPDTVDSFGYSIALGYQSMSPGLYTNGSSQFSNDIWSGTSNIYGGAAQLKTGEAGFDPAMALTPSVRLTGGSQLAGYAVSTTQTSLGGGLFDLTVEIASADLSLFDAFDLFWATADCANDVIWGSFVTASGTPSETPVPAPASFALLLAGLAGLASFRPRPATGDRARA
ncbi:MAG: hypothetical protein AB7I36_07170 [Rhodospirillaceae bacterium]